MILNVSATFMTLFQQSCFNIAIWCWNDKTSKKTSVPQLA